MTSQLNDDEQMLVDTVRAFIDRDVKPTVNEVEHANEYPAEWIDTMKEMGIFGLAVPKNTTDSPSRCKPMFGSRRNLRAAG